MPLAAFILCYAASCSVSIVLVKKCHSAIVLSGLDPIELSGFHKRRSNGQRPDRDESMGGGSAESDVLAAGGQSNTRVNTRGGVPAPRGWRRADGVASDGHEGRVGHGTATDACAG